jgi:hypothetical protein
MMPSHSATPSTRSPGPLTVDVRDRARAREIGLASLAVGLVVGAVAVALTL